MRGFFITKNKNLTCRYVSRLFVCFLTVSLVFSPVSSYAQSILDLPVPGSLVSLSPSYTPAIMAGMTIYPENPLQFNFIIDVGDDNLQGEELKKESQKLISYFMATLTVPEDEMWVNLSPYEKDRIIAVGLGNTVLGRDMLAQDYILKQLTASMMYPEDELGNRFWQRVYAKAQEKFGTTEIPTNTFNKIWIIPEEAVVYVNGTNVFVADSHLKVMLEGDYLALEHHDKGLDSHANEADLTKETKDILREIFIPEIEKEVNEGKNFANLRQIYHSMILANWYKNNLKESLLGKVYVNRNKTNGIEVEDSGIKDKIYNQYIEAFKTGVYDYIKEDYDEATQQIIPRKYFSGGENFSQLSEARSIVGSSPIKLSLRGKRSHFNVAVETPLSLTSGKIINRNVTWISRRKFLKLLGIGGTVVALGGLSIDAVAKLAAQEVQDDTGRKSFFLVGMNHKNSEDDDFQERMVKLASNGRAVVAVEGVERNDAEETQFVQAAYGLKEKGFVYGLENDFANNYPGVLLHYGYLATNMTDEIPIAKVQLVYDLRNSIAIIENWEKLKRKRLSVSAMKLYDDINRFMRDNEKLDIKDFVIKFYHNLNQYGTDGDWLETYKVLAQEMTKVVAQFQGDLKLDVEGINKYLEKPNDTKAQEYVVFEVNIKWRNKFVVNNIKELAKIAKEKKVDLFVLIGLGHVSDLSNSFEGGHEGLVKRVYYRTELVPEDFIPSSKAKSGSSPITQDYGGIDFNANNLNLKEQGQVIDINFTNLLNIQPNTVNGVTPVIINITPITNFPLLLGEIR